MHANAAHISPSDTRFLSHTLLEALKPVASSHPVAHGDGDERAAAQLQAVRDDSRDHLGLRHLRTPQPLSHLT